MKMPIAAFALSLCAPCFAQAKPQAEPQPTLQETFDWMTSTLRPSEGNNWYIHRPYSQPYPKQWIEEDINPFHQEIIKEISHDKCRMRVVVDVIDNDMGTLLGLQLYETETDTFELKDIDPSTIKVTNSCEPIETATGKTAPFNCDDEAGLQMEFGTRNAQPSIHREGVNSSYQSQHGIKKPVNGIDQLCKADPKYPYCPSAMKSNAKDEPTNVTSDTPVFHTPAYTKRFIKAFRHAVELCGGKPSTF